MIGRFIAQILAVESVFMLPALGISLYRGEHTAIVGFCWSLLIMLAVEGVLFWLCRGAKRAFYAREGFWCVGVGWIVLSLAGCLPFVISGEIPHFIDALFEIVSGFTTTGASILTDIESLPYGILYWRSFSHWLGGMGVLVFLLAFKPSHREGSGFTMHLLNAESPGPDVGKLAPKMRVTAMSLYFIYLFLTVLNFVFLLLGDMPAFEALCTAFGTAGTGGFGVKNDSLAGYSHYIQNVTTVFMLLFGINFSCYYLLLLGKLRNVFKDQELRMYFCIVLGSVALISLNCIRLYETVGETLRHSFFQVASIITTTGFVTTDFDLWPSFSKVILVGLMFIGACAGSTGGGFKCARVLMLFKNLYQNVQHVIHPRRVQVVRNNGKPLESGVLENTNAYLSAYVLILFSSVILISLDNFSFETNFTAVMACFNNIGPGLGAVGPTGNFASYGIFSKLILIFDMLAGRLEIFPMLILFSGGSWRHR